MRIDQVVVSAAPGDAVTNSAFAYRDILRRLAPSEVFARHVHPDLDGDVLDLSTFHQHRPDLPRRPDDVIVFHGSIGSPEVFAFLEGRPERIVLIYHNVSPASAYQEYDPAFAELLAGGRRDIQRLARRVALALAPSAFNARELTEMGYPDVRVSPLVVETSRLRRLEPDQDLLDELDRLDGPVLLSVGQLLPHKQPERLVAAFHVLSTYLRPEAHLLVVGASRSAPYRQRLDAFIERLALPRLRLLGTVSDHALAACFTRADAFATTSAHEGFCVPLLEAMAFEVPIVARACGAVPETLGDAGLLIPAEAGPLLFAEAVHRVLGDDPLRASLTQRGTARLEHFRADDARTDFLHHLATVL